MGPSMGRINQVRYTITEEKYIIRVVFRQMLMLTPHIMVERGVG
jgi:hypothetical protein